jgi:hypothetical protein
VAKHTDYRRTYNVPIAAKAAGMRLYEKKGVILAIPANGGRRFDE